MTEIWKPIPGYDGYYEASSLGRLKSVARTCDFINRWGQPCVRIVPEKILAPCLRGEYLASTLIKDGKRKKLAVHLWVLLAFKGPKPNGMCGCHNDGSYLNNCIDNLRYDSQSGNLADRWIHGTHIAGENNSNAKLSEQDVIAIRATTGLSQEKLGEIYGVGQHTISSIKLRKTWKHI